MTSHSDGDANDHNCAAVVGTVASGGGSVGDGAVATVGAVVTVANPDDATIALTGNHPKSSFPRKRESRTNNSAQPSEFNTALVSASVTTAKLPMVTGGLQLPLMKLSVFTGSYRRRR